MRFLFSILIPSVFIMLVSCGNKDNKTNDTEVTVKDTVTVKPAATTHIDTTLSSAKPAIEK